MTPLSSEVLWSVLASDQGFKILGSVEIVLKVTLWRPWAAGKDYSWRSFQDIPQLLIINEFIWAVIQILSESQQLHSQDFNICLDYQPFLWYSRNSPVLSASSQPASQPWGLDALITHYTLQKTPSDRLFQTSARGSLHNHNLNLTSECFHCKRRCREK